VKVFLDASALVPLALERDQWYLEVRRQMRAIQQISPPELLTTNWTYYEALSICRRGGMHTVAKLQRMVDAQVQVAPVQEVLEAEALQRFLTWHDKTASVVDHANLLVALEAGCAAILTFDDDFLPLARGTGVRVLR
jgi:predicted nucleic acid-binding protein